MTQAQPVPRTSRARHLRPAALEERRQIALLEAQRRFRVGSGAERALLERVAATVIRDKLAFASGMHFEPHPLEGGAPAVHLRYGTSAERFTIHRHALAQLAGKAGLPLSYVAALNAGDAALAWRTDLLCHNLNELFGRTSFVDGRGAPVPFLHRLVGTELRGFLSNRFNRNLASAPLLAAYVDACRAAGAHPVEAVVSDVRFSLKCYAPHVFEPLPGQYICVGVEWSNSDFGAGKHLVCQTVWDPLRDTRVVLDETISRVHLGSVIEESDIEMSAATAAKEVDAQASAICDAVTQQLKQESIDRLLDAIRIASEQEIPWTKLKGQLQRFLYRKDLETIELLLHQANDVIDLPPPGRAADGTPLPTKWWASSIVSWIASKSDDEDRKLELQHEAGRLLAGLVPKGDAP
jgi:hypothetical protein